MKENSINEINEEEEEVEGRKKNVLQTGYVKQTYSKTFNNQEILRKINKKFKKKK